MVRVSISTAEGRELKPRAISTTDLQTGGVVGWVLGEGGRCEHTVGEVASLICRFCVGEAARKFDKADSSLRDVNHD